MKVVRKAQEESGCRAYVCPQTNVVLLQHEGVLCFSVQGIAHESFTEGDEFTI